MIVYVIGLVLLAALLHATWNAMLHRNSDPFVSMTWMSVSIAVLSAVAIPFLPAPARAAWPYIVASGLIHIAYNMSLIRAYQSGEFGETYPIARGSSPVLVSLGAAAVARDHLGLLHILGVLLVSLGIIYLAMQRGPISRTRAAAALLTGTIIALYTVIDGTGVRLSGNAVAYTAWIFLFYSLMPVVFIGLRHAAALRVPFTDVASSMTGGLVSIAAYGIVIWAMQFGAMGAVSALRETSVVFAALIARFFLKERLTVRRLGACTVIALGAVCIGT
jgi:drug/metabolite transporter (DMT)-like permease